MPLAEGTGAINPSYPRRKKGTLFPEAPAILRPNLSMHSTRAAYVPPKEQTKPGKLYMPSPAEMVRFRRSLSSGAAAVGPVPISQKNIAFMRGLSHLMLPIQGATPADLTSDFGPRVHPVTGRYSFHTGADLSAALGTPVYAPANGVIEDINFGDNVYGNQIIMGHGRHKETMYGHLSQIAGITPGEKIKKGDVIGYVGSTGLSTGPHLHWETWVNGNPVNPLTFIGGN